MRDLQLLGQRLRQETVVRLAGQDGQHLARRPRIDQAAARDRIEQFHHVVRARAQRIPDAVGRGADVVAELRIAQPEFAHGLVDLLTADQANEHIGRGVIAIVDHQAQQLLDRAHRVDRRIDQVAPAVVLVAGQEVQTRIEVDASAGHLPEDLDHHRDLDRRRGGKARAGVDAGGHAGGQIFDRDAYATGSVHGG